MAKVYVVNEPLRKDPTTGKWGRGMDLSPAAEFGELEFLLPAGRVPQDIGVLYAALLAGLARYTESDYLLPIGDTVAMCMSAAIVAWQMAGQSLQFLRWNHTTHRYTVERFPL